MPIDTLALRAHTSVLAHDSLEGRGTGSAGSRAAAAYIAAQLRAIGLRPLATTSGSDPDEPFLIRVPLLRADVSSARLTVDGTPAMPHGTRWVLGRVGREGLRAASGTVTPVSDDSAQVSAGTWVLVDGPLGERAVRWLPAWRSAGAVGVIVRLASDATLEAYRAQLGDVRWQLAEGPPDPVWQPDLPIVMIGSGLADQVLADSAR